MVVVGTACYCCNVYAGLPGISVPCGYDSQTKMPVGVQFIGQAFGEAALLETAHVFEQTLAMKKPAAESMLFNATCSA